jgi:hypothetical protein
MGLSFPLWRGVVTRVRLPTAGRRVRDNVPDCLATSAIVLGGSLHSRIESCAGSAHALSAGQRCQSLKITSLAYHMLMPV